MHHIETHLGPGDKAFWEHVKQCKHCGLIWEDVNRKAMVISRERARKASIDPRYTDCM